MSTLSLIVSVALCLAGAMFFVAGSVGLLRFPDVYARLHALAKADNVGLGLIAVGVALQAESWLTALKILIIWLLALIASATACNLIANSAVRRRIPPWTTGER